MKKFTTIILSIQVILLSNLYSAHPTLDALLEHISFGFYGNAAVGDTSTNPQTLAAGHHDPTREDGTVQGLEASVSARFEKLEAFATHNYSYGAEKKWEHGWEEAFIKLKDLVPDAEFRAGRALTRFGSKNAQHLHAWDEVDMPIVLGQFLGDDGLKMNGGDVTYFLPIQKFKSGFTLGYGKQLLEAHGEEEEEHGDEEEGHEEEEDHDEEHGHSDDFGRLRDRFFSAKFFSEYLFNDFHKIRFGTSLAVGENHFDKDTWITGIDFAYNWRENGLEAGGKAFSLSTEILNRRIETTGSYEENSISDSLNQLGAYVSGVYTFNPYLDLGARIGHMESLSELEVEDRTRLSPVITVYPHKDRNVYLRLQYNHDEIGTNTEDGVWLQAGFAFGGSEVR